MTICEFWYVVFAKPLAQRQVNPRDHGGTRNIWVAKSSTERSQWKRSSIARAGWGDEWISAPGLGTLRTAIWQNVATMVEAVKTGDPADGGLVSGRLYTLKGADTPESSDSPEAAEIAKLMELFDGDSVHRLVTDMRKAVAAGGSQT